MREYKIGIVGGSGFIGSALAGYLVKSFRVKILDKNPVSKDLHGKVEFQRCDVRKYNEVERNLNDVDVVIHTSIVQIPRINEEKMLGYKVNVLGTQNICEATDRKPSIKGLILAGSWHVFGERGLKGTIDEEFGFRPDKVEDRALIYALCKIAQETIVRLHDEMSDKIYGVTRMGTVLGEGMPEKTAANTFISKGLRGEDITPYKHSMHRPMLYVDINDVCRVFEAYTRKILNGEIRKEGNSLTHIVNLCWPEPITILKLATMVRDAIVKYSEDRIRPKIRVIDIGQPSFFTAENSESIKVDVSKVKKLLGLENLTSPKESIEKLVKGRISKQITRAIEQVKR